MGRLTAVNMTNFFSRDLLMYSLGDIHLKKPVSLKKAGYTMLFILLWTVPLLFIFGLQLNVYFVTFVIIPPFILGHFATKPAFGGKTLVDYVKSSFKFLFNEPKGWCDYRANNKLDQEVLQIENEIWISRRRELQYLADLKEAQIKNGDNV